MLLQFMSLRLDQKQAGQKYTEPFGSSFMVWFYNQLNFGIFGKKDISPLED